MMMQLTHTVMNTIKLIQTNQDLHCTKVHIHNYTEYLNQQNNDNSKLFSNDKRKLNSMQLDLLLNFLSIQAVPAMAASLLDMKIMQP